MHGRTGDFLLLGTGRKCNELLIIPCIFYFFFNLWGMPPTLALTAYSHDSVAKPWPRNCEVPGSKPCRCAILVPFCEALILISVSYDLRTQVHLLISIVAYTCFSSHAKQTLANCYSIKSECVYYYLNVLGINHCQNVPPL